MKLFTKDIDKKLFAQFEQGSDLSKQKVIAKIYNPTGRGTWYIVNSDESDPDYLWAIVDLLDVEAGSVSRSELESIKVPPFKLPLERDMYFTPINAAELYRGLRAGKTYAEGGEISIEAQNKDMLLNYAEELEHHVEEFEEAAKGAEKVMPWVIAKIERASTDLSDVTHYLASENEKRREYEDGEGEEEYANGGEVKWQDAHYGDNALVVSENKMGIIIKPYGRKFHLRFADGTEKTYDANELKFFKDMDDFDMGEEVEGVDLFEDYENIPEKVQQILDNYADAFEDGDYKGLEKANKALFEIGYTFDYGLDGQAYDLRKVGEKGKSDSYARGGRLDVGRYYKTKDGRQVRYLGDTKDPEVGTFMNKADGVFKVKYDEIEGHDSLFASGGMMAKGGYIEFEEIIPEKKLIDLLKSIDFKTFNSKEIKFITRKEIVEKPKYRQFYEKIHLFLNNVGHGVFILFSNLYNSVGYNVYITVTFRMGRQIIPKDEYAFKIENLNFSEFEKGLKKAVKENIVTLMVDNGVDSRHPYFFYFSGNEQDAEKFALNEGYEKVYYETEEKYYKDLKNRKNTAKYPSFEKDKYHEYEKEYDDYGFSYFYYNPKFDFENEKSKLIRNNIKRPSELHLGRFTDAKVKNLGITTMTDSMETVNEISRLAGIQTLAVAQWGDKNNINLSILLKDLKSKKIKGMDLMTAIAGEPNNKYQKELLAKYSRTKMADGGMMAKGGEIKKYPKNYKTKSGKGVNPKYNYGLLQINKNGDIFLMGTYSKKETAESQKIFWEKNYAYPQEVDKWVVDELIIKEMAMGGKVKFADKVKSIKASLLERKKVSPKVQKDYGKTYSPKEAEESAKRIVGAMTAKERLMAKKKKK